MKRIKNAYIEGNTSSWNDYYHCLDTDNFCLDLPCLTIKELFDRAYQALEQADYGIARIYDGKYQLGTVTKDRYQNMDEYYTRYGRQLMGQKDMKVKGEYNEY